MGTALLILKVIAFILLFILFSALIIIAGALFIPISYRLDTDNDDKLCVFFKAFILFKMFGFSYFYKNGFGEIKFILFWRSVDYNKIVKPKAKTSPKTSAKKKKAENYDEDNHNKNKPEKNRNDNHNKSEKIKKKQKKIKRKKTGNTINNIKEKYEIFKSIENKKEILNQSFILIRKLIKALKNEYFKISLSFGFSEPDKTGIVLGLGCIAKTMLPAEIELEPDFENERFEYKAELKGKTSVFRLIVPIIKFILKKPIYNLIFKGKDDKKDERIQRQS